MKAAPLLDRLAALAALLRANRGWVLGGALVLAFYLWTASSSGDPFDFGKNQSDYYNRLTDGFLQGHLYLSVDPAPELLALPDPYDPEANAPYRLHDASLYDDHYYLYFGPAPAVLAFLPWRILPGDLPQTFAVAMFAFIGASFAVALLRDLTRRYLPETPGWMLGAGAVALVTASVIPFTLRRVAVYEVAIACAYALVFAGLWCLATGMLGERLRPRRLAAASLLLGLAVAARPSMVVPSALLVVACLAIWRRDDGTARERMVALLLGPIVACGVALVIYNQLRFGSPFETGLSYQLTGGGPGAGTGPGAGPGAVAGAGGGGGVGERDSLNPDQILTGLWHYLLARPHFTLGFPFIHLTPPPASYPGTLPQQGYTIEEAGGVLTTAPILILTAGAWWVLRRPEDRELRLVVLLLSLAGLGSMLLIMMVIAGATMRYEVDFASLLLIPALLVWFALARRPGRLVRAAGLAAITWGAIVGIAISITGYYDGLRTNKPGTYEFLEDVTSPLPTAFAVLGGTTTVTSIIPAPPADTDPGPGYGRWDLDVPPTGTSLTIVAHKSQRVALDAGVGGTGTLTAVARETGGRASVRARGAREQLQLPVERGINHVDLRTSGDVVALRDATLAEQSDLPRVPTGLLAASTGTKYLLSLSPSLYWTLDSADGAVDQSGNDRDGTSISIGGYSDSGISAGVTSTVFDGTDDRIRSSYNPFTNGKPRTFVGWAYRDTSTSFDTLLGGDAESANDGATIFLDLNGTNLVLKPNGNDGTSYSFTSAWPGNGQWVHWALVFNESADTADLYINGSLSEAKTGVTEAYSTAPGNFTLGDWTVATDSPFDGKMAHVAVFERALTPTEVENLYAGR